MVSSSSNLLLLFCNAYKLSLFIIQQWKEARAFIMYLLDGRGSIHRENAASLLRSNLNFYMNFITILTIFVDGVEDFH